MPQILLPRYPVNARETGLICTAPNIILRDSLNRQPTTLQANTPYMIGDQVRPGDLDILSIISAANAASDLSQMTEEFGSDGVQVLASLQEHMAATFSSGASVYGERMHLLKSQVGVYEQALMAYRQARLAGSPLQIAASEKVVRNAFNKLQKVFHNEIQLITADVKSRRGLVLRDPQRALNIAGSSRRPNKLHVQSQTNAHQLVRFTKHTKFFTNGMAVIDFTGRVGHISNAYTAGDDWHREMFVQSASFAVSATAATITVKAGAAALGAVMMLTPLGPVALLVAGAVIVGSAMGVGYVADSVVSSDSGAWYDGIMRILQ